MEVLFTREFVIMIASGRPDDCHTDGRRVRLKQSAHDGLLQAFGKKKAEAVRNAVEGPISSLCPGSVLQLHPLTTFFVDSEAADLLTMKDYYLATIRENDRLRAEGRL